MIARTAALLTFAAAAVSAQSIPATASAEQLALVDAQYENSGLDESGCVPFLDL